LEIVRDRIIAKGEDTLPTNYRE